MDKEDDPLSFCGSCFSALGFIGAVAVLIFVFGSGIPVQVSVEEASLERLALVAPSNGTASFAYAYNLSFAVAVHNANWPMRVWRVAPLDAELRLRGQPFALVRLAGGETEDRISPLQSKVYHAAAAAAKSAPVELGSGAVAAFARESAVGMFPMEIIVAGAFKYEGLGHFDRFSIKVRCPVRLPLSTSPTAVAFARFDHTLPQECEYLEQHQLMN